MDILSFVNLISFVGNIGLGLFVFLKDPAKKINRSFALFCGITGLWSAENFMNSAGNWSEFWFKATYALAPAVIASAAVWIINMCQQKLNRTYGSLLLGSCILFSLLPFTHNLLFLNLSETSTTPGPLLGLYSAYFAAITAYLFYLLFRSYPRTSGITKKQIGYVLVGVMVPGSIGVISSAILPMFGITLLWAIDSPSMLFFIIMTAFAITRYHLFDIKIILSEILVGLTGAYLFFMIFAAANIEMKIAAGAGFIIYFAFGYYLIKTIHEERKRKEQAEMLAQGVEKFNELLESMVSQRTEKLREKTDELEKFYRLTIGRELEMAELKKKIKELESGG